MSAVLSLLLAASIILAGPQSALAYGTDGSDPGAVHEGLVGYAMNVYQGTNPNTEMNDYLGTIQHGAWHEDQIDLVDDVIWGAELFCLTQTHFWDGDKGRYDLVNNVAACGFEVRNSWQKAEILWGMALGEYRSGDKAEAYEYLGHVAHLLADQSVPAHAHEDAHSEGDIYEEWMTSAEGVLDSGEMLMLELQGPVEIPIMPADRSYGEYAYNDPIGPLYYLFYTTNQIGDYFPSDGEDGDSGWNAANGDWIGGVFANLPTIDHSDLDEVDDNGDMLEQIYFYSYFYAIRSTAALFDLFWQEASTNSALTVVIDEVLELNDTEGDILGDHADFYVEVEIDGYEYRNEGKQNEDVDHIYPNWAFGRNVGITGDKLIVIELFDEDDGADDPSPIDPVEGRSDLDFWVNLDTGVIRLWEEPYTVLGNCGDLLVSEGHPDDDDRSRIWYRVLLPNIPPDVKEMDNQTVDEGDDVMLTGIFTDPNQDDSWTYEWKVVNDPNNQGIATETGSAVPNTPTEFTFIPWDNGDYIFSLTVTDSFGASDTEEVMVTVENVPPEINYYKLTDELGAEIGVDVPVALVGLEVNLEAGFTDDGYTDNHTVNIYWGDGEFDPETAFNLFVDSTGWQLGYLHATHIYATPGNFTITLKVTDDDGDWDIQTIPIEIVDAAGAIEYVIESLEQHADNPDIQAALDKMQGEQDSDVSNGAIDLLEKENWNAALEKIKQALEFMEAAEAADPNLDLTFDKGLLALAAKSVAVGAITEAEEVAYKQKDLQKIEDATDLVAEGDVLLAVPDCVSAVDKYQEAVRKVQGIP